MTVSMHATIFASTSRVFALSEKNDMEWVTIVINSGGRKNEIGNEDIPSANSVSLLDEIANQVRKGRV